MFKFTLKDDIDRDITLLNMCGSMRYTCMPNMKYLFFAGSKVKSCYKDDLEE